MKAIILAGGLGTRLSEETVLKPKPLVEIGGKPILWHIMKMYSAHGINDFIVCLGYKGHLIKEFFANYTLHMSDITFDVAKSTMTTHRNEAEDWRVTLIDTGEATMTGGRLKRVIERVKDEEAFCLTYGDGVSDIDIGASLKFHQAHGKLATVSAMLPPRRFGILEMEGDKVIRFTEKPKADGSHINGGFFVLSPKVARYLGDDATVWEEAPLRGLAKDGELNAFRHDGFFQPMDTVRDKAYLEELWDAGEAPWKQW
jgi:glucose-1-phosphate cytidylyltransferase